MGTRFEVVLFGDDPVHLRAAGEAALDVIHDWDRRLNWFSPASTLSYINARAAESPVAVDREIFDLLVLCREVSKSSGGAFDVTIAPLMAALGFRPGVREQTTLADARARVGMELIALTDSPHAVGFLRAGVSIDLGSIAKGAALDAAAAVLRECGITSALFHGGTSSVAAIGAPPGRDSWPVAIETGHAHRPVVHLRDSCLSVSAPRGRTVTTDRGPAGHIIDPRTGAPAARVGTAAVVHARGALADAWSTALVVLGQRPPAMPDDLISFIDIHPVCETAA